MRIPKPLPKSQVLSCLPSNKHLAFTPKFANTFRLVNGCEVIAVDDVLPSDPGKNMLRKHFLQLTNVEGHSGGLKAFTTIYPRVSTICFNIKNIASSEPPSLLSKLKCKSIIRSTSFYRRKFQRFFSKLFTCFPYGYWETFYMLKFEGF